MLQKEAQVIVPESKYGPLLEALHNCLYNKGGKPSESLFETVLKAVMWGLLVETRGGYFLLHIFFRTRTKYVIKDLFAFSQSGFYSRYPLSVSQQQ